MKIIIILCIPLLILAILTKKNVISGNIGVILTGIIIAIGLLFVFRKIYDITMRDNMNFDEYNWFFDPSAMDPTVYQFDVDAITKLKTNLQADIGLECIGSSCCKGDTKWNPKTMGCEI